MSDHLGYETGDLAGYGSGNSRNRQDPENGADQPGSVSSEAHGGRTETLALIMVPRTRPDREPDPALRRASGLPESVNEIHPKNVIHLRCVCCIQR
ncbi:hypothetical protein [Psychromicrobium sp. YIM B11713]|uniref:hypothetical protein n=1 Tax=Psychromicrobium sp. YIM B11713 TaxID=3145233 RepID=UPI00374EC47B